MTGREARTNWWVFWLVRIPMMWGGTWLLLQAFGATWTWKAAFISAAIVVIIELAWPSSARRARPEPRPPVELAPGQAHVVVAVAGPRRLFRSRQHAILGEVVITPVGDIGLGFTDEKLIVVDDVAGPVLEIADWRSKMIHRGALGLAVRMVG